MCQLCETKPVYEFTNKRKLCKNCFIHWFQKKVLYTIRKFSMIQSGETVEYKRGTGFREIVLEDVLKMYSGKGDVQLVVGKQGNKIAVSNTSDFETYSLIEELFNGSVRGHKPVEGKMIKPLYLFLDKEVLLYANLRNLNFNEKKEIKNKLNKFIDSLEEKHPELKQAVVSSILVLK